MSSQKANTYKPILGSHNPSYPQGAIRTEPRKTKRPSPVAIPKRSRSLKDPFGPQVPLPLAPPIQAPGVSPQHLASISTPRSPSALAGPVFNFLDLTFRTYAERIQNELIGLRSVCSKAVFREQQDKEKWRSHCFTFKQERDVARERVRALINEREAQKERPNTGDESDSSTGSRGVKRMRAESSSSGSRSRSSTPSSATAVDDSDEVLRVYTLSYPSPMLPPVAKTIPKRSQSAGPVLCSAIKGDGTALDITVSYPGGISLEEHRLAKRRKSESDASTSTKEPVEVPRSAGSPKTPSPPSPLVPRYAERPATPVTPPSTVPRHAIDLTHVDIMYAPANGKLECRVCLLKQKNAASSPSPYVPKSFPTDASWDILRSHCVAEHPSECADVGRLHPAELFELRRRLGQR